MVVLLLVASVGILQEQIGLLDMAGMGDKYHIPTSALRIRLFLSVKYPPIVISQYQFLGLS